MNELMEKAFSMHECICLKLLHWLFTEFFLNLILSAISQNNHGYEFIYLIMMRFPSTAAPLLVTR